MEIINKLELMALNKQKSSLYKAICANIDGINTEIVYADHSDKLIIFATQYQKIGSLLSITKDQVETLDHIADAVYTVTPVAGPENIEQQAAARYIAEKLDINKKIYFFICLKSYDREVVKGVTDALLNLKDNLI